MTEEHKPRHASEKRTYTDPIYCRETTCDNHTKDDKWNKIKATTAGWFFSKEGWATCPKHPPAWLKEWREKRHGA